MKLQRAVPMRNSVLKSICLITLSIHPKIWIPLRGSWKSCGYSEKHLNSNSNQPEESEEGRFSQPRNRKTTHLHDGRCSRGIPAETSNLQPLPILVDRGQSRTVSTALWKRCRWQIERDVLITTSNPTLNSTDHCYWTFQNIRRAHLTENYHISLEIKRTRKSKRK